MTDAEQKLAAKIGELARRDAELVALRETLAVERSTSEKLRLQLDVRRARARVLWPSLSR